MYFNVDLQEVEYFNPKNTIADMFFDFFYSKTFLNEGEFISNNNSYA